MMLRVDLVDAIKPAPSSKQSILTHHHRLLAISPTNFHLFSHHIPPPSPYATCIIRPWTLNPSISLCSSL